MAAEQEHAVSGERKPGPNTIMAEYAEHSRSGDRGDSATASGQKQYGCSRRLMQGYRHVLRLLGTGVGASHSSLLHSMFAQMDSARVQAHSIQISRTSFPLSYF